jgi:hypothetical protein
MARSTATPSGGAFQMNMMGGSQGEKDVPKIQSRHHIGFKDRQNQGFKTGGPVRATGAIYEK